MSENTKPAVGYIRMSTDKQEDSPARQRQDINSLAQRMGYEIVQWYEDHGLTGTISANRPEFLRLLADAKEGAFSAILLSEQSRMSREDVFDAMVHWKMLRDANVAIVTCQRGELKFDNLGGVITAIVDQYGAREESIKLADRVVSGKRLAVSQGQRQGGALYGYDREILDERGELVRRVSFREQFTKPRTWSSRLVVSSDSKAVEAVRHMFQWISEGRSFGSVARELNRLGYKTMHDKRFTYSTVKQAVINPAYMGTLRIGKKKYGRFASVGDNGMEILENAHEAIVDRDLFERVQRILRQNHRPAPPTTPGRYLLTGIIFLADEDLRLKGGIVSHRGRKKRRRCYSVSGTNYEKYPERGNWPAFDADIVERGILAKLRQFVMNDRNRVAIHREIDRRTKKSDIDVTRLESQLADMQSRIERGTQNLALANPEDIPGISRLLAEWRGDADSLRSQIHKHTDGQAPSPEALDIMERLGDFTNRLAEVDREKLAFAIRQTVKRITLRRYWKKAGKHRIMFWDGTIELRDDLGLFGVIPITDEDIPAPGRWREAVQYIRERGETVYVHEVAEALNTGKSFTSCLLAQAVLSGKVINLGHQKGWIAAK